VLALGLEFRVWVVRLRLRLGLGVSLGLRLGIGEGNVKTWTELPWKNQSE